VREKISIKEEINFLIPEINITENLNISKQSLINSLFPPELLLFTSITPHPIPLPQGRRV
jgi:hypothetical protein